MLKKVITYEDYDGVERTENFYFNLSKTEITKLELKTPGGMQARIQRITDAKDVTQVMQLFEDIIDLAYGVKTEDGKRFIKSENETLAFKQSPAYDILFMELLTDENSAMDFLEGIVPNEGKKAVQDKRKELAAGK